jgi:ribosome recycling factor
VQELLAELSLKMQKAVDSLAKELSSIHTGRATSALVEGIAVNYHGALVPLQQLASISVPKSDLITIQPWDRSVSKDIQKAITKANIGLNPQDDGGILRIPIPHLSEERRIELARLISKRVEEHRIAVRNIRRDGVDRLKKMEKDRAISQDHCKEAIKRVDELSDVFIEKLDKIGYDREKEIKEV